MYPIELMPDVSSNATSYRHLIRPWSPYAESEVPGWSSVFMTQLLQWEGFRWWQLRSRRRDGLPPDLKIPDWDRWADLDGVSSIFAADFRSGSVAYPAAARKLLTHYGFDRHVQFLPGPRQQDKLTEWLEYLVFEYSEHYRYARRLAFRQPEHAEAWEKVVGSGLLRPFETREYVCDPASRFSYQDGRSQAERAVRQAEAALEAALGPPSGRQLSLPEATSQLAKAKEALDLDVRRWNHILQFLHDSRVFLETKRRLRTQDHIIRWVLDEIPVVEAEARNSGPETARPASPTDAIHEAGAAPSHKRTRQAGGGAGLAPAVSPSSKRRKPDARKGGSAGGGAPTAKIRRRQTRSRRKQTPPKSDQVALPLCRSARVGAGRP